mmetsp:Transcript_3295/g.8534  ORF Transcript_3295/g.8534 Transcript_3295/m.8534 type:complete len:137 (+) Transcript_3295:3203-3613(+)
MFSDCPHDMANRHRSAPRYLQFYFQQHAVRTDILDHQRVQQEEDLFSVAPKPSAITLLLARLKPSLPSRRRLTASPKPSSSTESPSAVREGGQLPMLRTLDRSCVVMVERNGFICTPFFYLFRRALLSVCPALCLQ